MDSKVFERNMNFFSINSINYPVLTIEEELDLARKYRDGDAEAGHTIILSNMRFARKISRRYIHLVDDPLDIIQNANLGLVKALTRFNPDMGVRFISYAIWWIKAYIKNYIHKSYQVKTGSIANAKNLVSLDCNISADIEDDGTLADNLQHKGPGQDELYTYKERSEYLLLFLRSDSSNLTEREVFIIEQRYLSDPPVTLKGISSMIGVTRERVRQIQQRSLEKIRAAIEDEGFLFPEDIHVN